MPVSGAMLLGLPASLLGLTSAARRAPACRHTEWQGMRWSQVDPATTQAMVKKKMSIAI